MERNYRYMQDGGGDQFDTSIFSGMIDSIAASESQQEPVDEADEVQEEEVDVDDEGLIGSDFTMDREDEKDIFDEMLNDNSFDESHEGRVSSYTKSFASRENKIESIAKSQLERNKYAYDYYMKRGLNQVQSAAIVGNLAQESGIRALNYGDRDSTGVAQWRTDRRKGMNSWAKSKGLNPNDLDTQLEYVKVEAEQRGDLQRIANHKDVRQATIDFGRKFERPSEKHANWDNRVRHASSVMGMQYGGIPYSQSAGGRVSYNNGLPLSNPNGIKIKFTPDGIPVSNPVKDSIASPITQPSKITSEPSYLQGNQMQDQQVTRISGTGEYRLPDEMNLINNLAQGATFVANMINNQRKKQAERELMAEDSRKPVYENYGINKISNIPSYDI
jgi:hypothetical protein